MGATGADAAFSAEQRLYLDNKVLNQAEFRLGRFALASMPRYLTVVLGNACNIGCRHCYQLKNGDNLLRDAELGADLRAELAGLYPYLSTLRLQGGEVFALRGFERLLEDVAAFVHRPLVSISTNGTLISERWARRLVELPLQSMTVSIDAGTAATYERLRRGASFDEVIGNLRRLQQLKRERGTAYPVLDAFFVVMRSNFREIPAFLDLLLALGIRRASFQVMLVDARNAAREPALDADEALRDPAELRELHALLQQVVEQHGPRFHRLSWSGLQDLLAAQGLDAAFLDEAHHALTPDQDDSAGPSEVAEERYAARVPPERHPDFGELPAGGAAEVCPNPWSTLFITENGDVSLCFLSDPIGNLYEEPLAALWNGPAAIAKRSRLWHGRPLASGCSRLWCGWREGRRGAEADPQAWRTLLDACQRLVDRLGATAMGPEEALPNEALAERRSLRAVRELLLRRHDRIRELEAVVTDLWASNGELHAAGRRHIDHLEARVRELEAELARRGDGG